MVVGAPQPQPIIGEGSFNYTMNAEVGPHGGNTVVHISANHNFDSIAPK